MTLTNFEVKLSAARSSSFGAGRDDSVEAGIVRSGFVYGQRVLLTLRRGLDARRFLQLLIVLQPQDARDRTAFRLAFENGRLTNCKE